MSDYGDIAAQYGVSVAPGAASGLDYPLDQFARGSGMDPATAIPFSTETTTEGLDFSTPYGMATRTDTVEVPELTVRDVYQSYFDMTEENRRAVHERLFTSGFYTTGTKAEDIHNRGRSESALHRAVGFFAAQGMDPLSKDSLPVMEMPEPDITMPEPDITVSRRYTEAQIGEYANAAAQGVFGRDASAGERQLAVQVFRTLEGDEASSPKVADVEAEFRAASPSEAADRSMSNTMRMFEQIISGAA